MNDIPPATRFPFFLRIGRDQKVIDRLAAPMQTNPIKLDGLMVDAPYAKNFLQLRDHIPASCRILVDHQAYRLQDDSFRQITALSRLPYAPDEGHIRPADFNEAYTRRFVQSVFDRESEAGATTYLAPAFYLERRASPWREVNARILKESINQVGGGVFATICGSTDVVCDLSLAGEISTSGATGAYLLISPFAPMTDSTSKMVNFLRFAGQLWNAGVEVIAGRQPAFGLGFIAAGLGGFDSGVAEAESFNYRATIRRRPKRRDGKGGGGAPRRIYFSDLMTSLGPKEATLVLQNPALRSLLSCDRLCCTYAPGRSLVRPHEHFILSRLEELREIRGLPDSWRTRWFLDRVDRARKIGEKIERTLPGTHLKFDHLSNWSAAVEAFVGSMQRVGS